MENDKVLESLDSNWFFSNVFKPPPPPPPSSSRSFKQPQEPKQAQPSIQVHQTPQIPSPTTQIQTESVPEANAECLQEDPSRMEPTRIMGHRSSSSRSRNGSKRREKKSGGEIKGFLELGLVLEEVRLGCRFVSDVPRFGRRRDGFERSGSPASRCKMPPYTDGMAMKEHLRSWAHAVACSVR